MPVTASDIKTYAAALRPNNDTDPVGGAPDLSGVLSQTQTNALIPSGSVPASADVLWRYKEFRKNEHGTASLYGAKAYLLNGLKGVHTQATAEIVSTDAGDNVGKVLLSGWVSGARAQDNITLTGTSAAPGAQLWDVNGMIRAQKISPGGARSPAIGDILIRVGGVLQGIIPAGYVDATWEFEFGFDPSQANALQTTNRLVDPVGVSFSRANEVGNGVAMPGTDLAAGSAIGIWIRFRRIRTMFTPVDYIEPVIALEGQDIP